LIRLLHVAFGQRQYPDLQHPVVERKLQLVLGPYVLTCLPGDAIHPNHPLVAELVRQIPPLDEQALLEEGI
jgi:hypothetical protein